MSKMQSVSVAKISIQSNTCKHDVLNMKDSNTNVESLDFMKFKGFIYFDHEDCTDIQCINKL